jgi:hypothetical protein
LHTLGGVVSAICAGDFKAEAKSPSSQTMYCNVVSFTLTLAALAMMLFFGLWQGIVIAVGSWLLLGPIWFLVASLLTWAWMRSRPGLPEREDYVRRLGRISIGMIAGTHVGTGLMALIALLFTWAQ